MTSLSSPDECSINPEENSGSQTPSKTTYVAQPMEHDSAPQSSGDYTWTDVVNRRVKKQKRIAERSAAAAQAMAQQSQPPKPSGRPGRFGKTHATPVNDHKVIVRPRDGLNFTVWSAEQVAMAFIDAAQLTAAEIDTVKIRIRRDQNLVVVSTPEPEVAVRVQELPAITINGRQYEILAYIALPDNSCRGVITGLDSRPTSEILSTRIRAQGAKVLCARMMGQTNMAIINFEGLKVPYYVYFRGAEYRCLPHRPREQICTACLGLGHRVDVCPHPEENKCCRYGKPGTADQEHDCNEKCVNCGGSHPATDSKCPARQWGPLNKAHVRRQLNRQPPVQRRPLTGLLGPRQKPSAPSTKVEHPQPRPQPSHNPMARVEFASITDPTPAEAAAMEQGPAPNPKKRNRNPPELPGQPPAVQAAELSDPSEPASKADPYGPATPTAHRVSGRLQRTPVYRKQGPKWCVASPGGPRRVQTYPGLGSTTRMPFSLDTGSPRTARRGHLAPKVQVPPAGLGVRGDATLQTPAFTGAPCGVEKLREESNAKLKALQAEMMGELDRRVCELAKVIHNDVQAQMRSFAEEIISQQESRFQQIIQSLIQPLTKQVAELTVQLRQIAQSRIMAPIPNESVVEITSNTAPTPTTVNTKLLPNPTTPEPPYTPQI
ncbi:hypothetical protein HPB47_009894 [Ixodes persulcatus]|uniref:Uncharacterized protein n=1 Tax=Ixodes persulcatus TaxID=34615 RepID=A0AC60P0M9_IXOPE|nr:hypothetical protein HPB47_009894 [Ixodes persulcatus]